MTELDLLIDDIDKMRENLYNLLKQKGGNMSDPEILSASKLLNAAINEYNKLLEKKAKTK